MPTIDLDAFVVAKLLAGKAPSAPSSPTPGLARAEIPRCRGPRFPRCRDPLLLHAAESPRPWLRRGIASTHDCWGCADNDGIAEKTLREWRHDWHLADGHAASAGRPMPGLPWSLAQEACRKSTFSSALSRFRWRRSSAVCSTSRLEVEVGAAVRRRRCRSRPPGLPHPIQAAADPLNNGAQPTLTEGDSEHGRVHIHDRHAFKTGTADSWHLENGTTMSALTGLLRDALPLAKGNWKGSPDREKPDQLNCVVPTDFGQRQVGWLVKDVNVDPPNVRPVNGLFIVVRSTDLEVVSMFPIKPK